MATPGDLTKVMAAAIKQPLETVKHHDQNLLAGGFRSRRGRGPSAPHVTPRDAANLLVAILGSPVVRDSAITVRRYAATLPYGGLQWPDRLREAVPEIRALDPKHSFVDAVTALITHFAAGSSSIHLAEVRVDGVAPGVAGIIQVRPDRDNEWSRVEYSLPEWLASSDEDEDKYRKLLIDLKLAGTSVLDGMGVQRYVELRVIQALAALFAGGGAK